MTKDKKKVDNKGPGRNPIPEKQRYEKALKQHTVNVSDASWDALLSEAAELDTEVANIIRKILDVYQNERLQDLARRKEVPTYHLLSQVVKWYLDEVEKRKGVPSETLTIIDNNLEPISK